MRKRALVIGSQTFGLTGVLSDTDRMARGLKALGFEVEACVQADATRAGILAAYQRLIDASGGGDCAMVYYSGHGARLDLTAGAGPTDRHVQFIIPTDFDQSTDDDFRGITAPELSRLQGALTAKTHNVTVVLDCCHSSAMSRAPNLEATVRSLDDLAHAANQHEELRARGKPWPQRVTEHLTRLRQQGTSAEGPSLESNPHAVRLAAAGVDESAWEYTNASGLRTGILTECLLRALEEARELAVSWEVLGRRIREQVLARFPAQRPELEGPVRRVVFGIDEPVPQLSLPYFTAEDRHWLRGGRLHGVGVGDEYVLMPFPAMRGQPEHALARAQVIDVRADRSEVTLTPPSPQGLGQAVAFQTRARLPRRPIGIEIPASHAERHAAVRAALEARLEDSPLVRRSTGEEEEGPVLALVCFTAKTIELRDRDQVLAARPRPATVDSVGPLLENLETLARAQSLRELESGTDAQSLTEPFSIEWGRVEAGQPKALPTSGACLAPGERFYVRFRNEGHTKLYATVFDVGVSSRIALLNSAEPSGLLLEPGMERWLGKRPGAGLEGFELAWLDSVPATGIRGLESLVIVVATAPQDLRSLEAQGVRGTVFQAPTSQLEALVRQAAWGGTREAVVQTDTVRYAVRSVSFLLEPPASK